MPDKIRYSISKNKKFDFPANANKLVPSGDTEAGSAEEQTAER